MKPARNIHPNKIFFKEIAAVIAEDNLYTVGENTTEEQIKLAKKIETFLEGGNADRGVLLAIAYYFSHDNELWENLWDNYITRQSPN